MTARSNRGSAIPGIASNSLPDKKVGCSAIQPNHQATMSRRRATGKS
jgi:hypothetical protein